MLVESILHSTCFEKCLNLVEDLVTSFDTVARDTENHVSVQHSCAVAAGVFVDGQA